MSDCKCEKCGAELCQHCGKACDETCDKARIDKLERQVEELKAAGVFQPVWIPYQQWPDTTGTISPGWPPGTIISTTPSWQANSQ